MFGIFSTIGNVVSNIYNQAAAAANAAVQTDLNLKADSVMRRRDISQTAYYWDKYNSPSAQMQAYTDAGLNPNLIYGQSNQISPVHSAGNVAGNVPFVPLDLQLGSVLNAISQLQDLKLKREEQDNHNAKTIAEINNLESQTSNNSIKSELYRAQITRENLSNELAKETNPIKRRLLAVSIEKMNETITTLQFQRQLSADKFDLDAKFRLQDYLLRKESLGLQRDRFNFDVDRFSESKRQFGLRYGLEKSLRDFQTKDFNNMTGETGNLFKALWWLSNNIESGLNSVFR